LGAQALYVTPESLSRIATVGDRYQSYNVEMAEVIGGTFWKPYDELQEMAESAGDEASDSGGTLTASADASMFTSRPPINLTNSRLRTLAEALGPAYMRVSGTWANTVYFHDSDTPAPETPPAGFQGVLTHAQWQGVIDFAQAIDAGLITSFAISAGVRDDAGVWTPDQARSLIEFTQTAGGEIPAAEFFNEPTAAEYGSAPAGYDAADHSRDFAIFRDPVEEVAPNMEIVGPAAVGLLAQAGDAVGGVIETVDLLTAEPRPEFDIFSYHFYPAASIRCAELGEEFQTTQDAALTESFLGSVDRDQAIFSGFRDRFQPGRPIWITEIADAACGGNPWERPFWTASAISTRSGGSRARACRRCSTTRSPQAIAASSTPTPSRRARTTGRPCCGAGSWVRGCSMPGRTGTAFTSTRIACRENRAAARSWRSTPAGASRS
jgi:heparanase 1